MNSTLRAGLAAIITATTMTLASAPASAQSPEWDSPDTPTDATYPQRFTLRPIVLPQYVVRGDVTGRAFRFPRGMGRNVRFDLNVGAAIGLVENLEVGISGERIGLNRRSGLVTFRVKPNVHYGDPYAYGRYRFVNSDVFEMAGELGVTIPFDTDFIMSAALPFRIRFGESFSLDGGVELDLAFRDEFGADIYVTIQPRLAPTESLYFGINTGVSSIEFNADATFIPLSFEGGYILDIAPTRVDFFGIVGFPNFIYAGSGPDRVFVDVYQFTFGARAYLDFS